MVRLVPLLVSLLLVAGCGDEERSPVERAVAETDVVVLDVRTDEEVAEGRAKGSVHVPLADIEAGLLPDIPKDATVFVYCRTGRRAEVAVRILRREGWEDVTNIGGLDDWRSAGGEVVS